MIRPPSGCSCCVAKKSIADSPTVPDPVALAWLMGAAIVALVMDGDATFDLCAEHNTKLREMAELMKGHLRDVRSRLREERAGHVQ